MKGFSVTLTAQSSGRDELIAELWDAGTTGITEEEDWLRAFFDASADAGEILRRFAPWNPRLEEEDDRDWVQHSQSLWHPLPVGERFWLTPEWSDEPPPEGRLRLPMRPGLACGSGWHPATQLCLQSMERIVRPNLSLLDVGIGSGILAEAALLLGARPAGCDIDHAATVVARRNIPGVPLFTGSLRSVRDAAFDIVVANLNAESFKSLGSQITRVARGGIIVSGFREEEQEQVATRLGRNPSLAFEQDGWACLVFSLAEM